jgi:hypothetical protein
LSLLPPELVSHVMYYMDLDDLYRFTLVNRTVYELSDDENLWRNAYIKSLPKIYSALSQLPTPEYWQYKVLGSRQFGFLILKEKQKQANDSPPPDLSKWISVTIENNTAKNIQFYDITWPPETKLVMDVMRNCIQKKSVSLMLTGCYLLRRLTYTPAECSEEYQKEMTINRNILGQYQAVEILLEILNDGQEDPALIAAAICAINNVACDYNCERIVKGLGIQAIIKSIKKYPSRVAVLDYGASALANIMREIQDENAVEMIVIDIDNILALFELPEALPKNLISVLDLCTVIARQNTQFCINFAPRVLPLVKELLVKNTQLHNDNLLFITCLTIHEFCNRSVENRKIALSLSLAPILLDIIEVTEERNILYSVFLALCFMLWESENTYKVEFERFVHLAVQKMKQNSQDAKLQLGLAVILGNYAAHNSSHWQFIKSFDISPLLVRAITTIAENPETYEDLFTNFELDKYT